MTLKDTTHRRAHSTALRIAPARRMILGFVRSSLAVAVLALALGSASAFAADDPSIVEPLRGEIQRSMESFIDHNTVDGVYRHYDPVTGELLTLELTELHAGIARKGDFYVSCADFTGQDGRKFDFDFFVLQDGEAVRTVQAIVHKAEGTKRPYDLEE